MENARGLLGVALVLAIAWALSEQKRRFPWRLALGSVGVQAGLVALLFALPNARPVLEGATAAIDGLAAATREGTRFVFGYLGGGPQPYQIADEGRLFVFAFEVLPLILVISALSALLWHWKILRWITQGFGFVFARTMGLSGPSALAVAANIFMGMVESPIVIRAYLEKLTRSELFLMMVVGLSTVAGSTMVAYATILSGTLANAAAHVLVASIISAPAGVLLARIIIPEPAAAAQDGHLDMPSLRYEGAMDAITTGVRSGLEVVFNISAILIVFVALVALGNQMLSLLPDVLGAPLTLERIMGALFAPLAWIIGVEWAEAPQAGYLLGVKLFLTEFVAFLELGAVPADAMSERTRMILTYALCGFANVGSVGIMIAGMTVLTPTRKDEIMGLAMRSLAPGFLATCMTAALVAAMPMGVFAR